MSKSKVSKSHSSLHNSPEEGGVCGLSAVQDRPLGRAGKRSVRFVSAKVQARLQEPRQGEVQRLPVQIAFALDRSGSMIGSKLRLAKQALCEALRQLQPTDTFAVAWFDSEVELVAPAQLATPEAVRRVTALCELVETGSSTALFAGWHTAFAALLPNLDPRAVARVLLLTDGQANAGPHSVAELVPAAQKMRIAGVCTSAIGVGEDFNEELLSALVAAGDGRFYYAAKPEQIIGFVTAELGEAKEVVARKVELRLRPCAGMKVELIGSLANQWNGQELCVLLGDLVSDQETEVAVRVVLPVGAVGDEFTLELSAFEGGEPALLPVQVCAWTMASHALNDAQAREVAVDRLVARQFAAQARMKAIGCNRRHEFAEATAQRVKSAAHIAGYAGQDAELLALVAELKREAAELAHRVDESRRKEMYTDSSHLSRSKRGDGTSTRTRSH